MKKVDKTGQRFGRLLVLGRAECKNSRGRWRCLCDCGVEKTVYGCSLTSGLTKSCGCLKLEQVSERSKNNVKDLSGQKFGRLLVVDRNFDKQEKMQVNSAYWNCQCDCGNDVIVRGSNLMRSIKPTQSCGCFAKESTAERNKKLYSLPDGESGFNAVYYYYQRNARVRGYEFCLKKTEFRTFVESNCFYCGASPSNCKKQRCNTGDYVYNGVDRKDNTKGYSLTNCVSCCGICNRMKLTMSQEEFKMWIKKAYDHWASK